MSGIEENKEKEVLDMANHSGDHLVQCPYYRKNYSDKLICEGAQNGMNICMTFPSHGAMIDYKGRFCRRSHYSQCVLAAMLDRKWQKKATKVR